MGAPERRGSPSGGVDHISGLPDAVLGTVISLLPIREGARTQVLSQRWRHLWPSATILDLDAGIVLCDDALRRASLISSILSVHQGPARRFHFPSIRLGDDGHAELDRWFHSPALNGLEDLDISYEHWDPGYPLPASALLRFASTLRAAKFGYWDFPDEIIAVSPSTLSFPHLNRLTLWSVSISPAAFRGVVSECRALQSLLLWEISFKGCLRVSSNSLRSIGFHASCSPNQELVIEEVPRLRTMLTLHLATRGETIRVTGAPGLEILGPLSPFNFKLQIATLAFEGMIPVSFTVSIRTVKVLALRHYGNIKAILAVLGCFPCLEKLYVIRHKPMYITDVPQHVYNPLAAMALLDEAHLGEMENMNQYEYDPLNPVECLESNLKKIVLKNYKGCGQDVSFAKFFVLNAKVLKEIEFAVPKNYDKKWVADQHSLLQLENRASRVAQFEFRRGFTNYGTSLDMPDLSMDDPFECMLSR